MTPPMRVLSIEDDPVDAYLISSAFARWGRDRSELCVARSLGEGLTRLEHERFAVVLLDLSLPVLDLSLPDAIGLYTRLTTREHLRYSGELQGLSGFSRRWFPGRYLSQILMRMISSWG